MLNNIISFPLDYSIILLYAQGILDFLLIGKMRHGICDNRTVLFNDATSDPYSYGPYILIRSFDFECFILTYMLLLCYLLTLNYYSKYYILVDYIYNTGYKPNSPFLKRALEKNSLKWQQAE